MGIVVAASIALLVGIVTSVTMAFADQERTDANTFSILYKFLQELKYGEILKDSTTLSTTDSISASIVVQLQDEVDELESRINSLENPAKIYSTEVLPITDIDCSNRNMVKAFLSGWCPHPSRNIYFIEDPRIQENSIIALSLDQKYDDNISQQSVCGVINQDVFNFSFHDEETGEVLLLEDLHGFIMKCDQSPARQDTILRYTIVNT